MALGGTIFYEKILKLNIPHESDRLVSLVVAWDSNVDKLGWRINIGKGNNRDVSIRCLRDRLMVSTRVSHNQETWFLECGLDLVSK